MCLQNTSRTWSVLWYRKPRRGYWIPLGRNGDRDKKTSRKRQHLSKTLSAGDRKEGHSGKRVQPGQSHDDRWIYHICQGKYHLNLCCGRSIEKQRFLELRTSQVPLSHPILLCLLGRSNEFHWWAWRTALPVIKRANVCGKIKGKSQKEWYLPGMSKDSSLEDSFTCLCPEMVGAGHTGLVLQHQVSFCLLGQLVHLPQGRWIP